jgi:hypothetical protein
MVKRTGDDPGCTNSAKTARSHALIEPMLDAADRLPRELFPLLTRSWWRMSPFPRFLDGAQLAEL